MALVRPAENTSLLPVEELLLWPPGCWPAQPLAAPEAASAQGFWLKRLAAAGEESCLLAPEPFLWPVEVSMAPSVMPSSGCWD